jgi:hypothetical protein
VLHNWHNHGNNGHFCLPTSSTDYNMDGLAGLYVYR